MRTAPALVLTLLTLTPLCSAALFSRLAQGSGNSKITLRKRLHVNTLITEPGTMEADWSNLYSFSTTSFTMPSAIRYTPEGSHIIWGRTEYSVAFDSLASVSNSGTRLTQFGQALSFTGVAVLRDGEKFDFAIAPQATVFLRSESGVRMGTVAIARYDSGRNSTGFTMSWSGATHSSPTNPAGTFDVGFGYGRQLSGRTWLEKLTPHLNVEGEKSTGSPRALLALEGIEYQMTEKLAFDLAAQHFVDRNAADHQIALGLTYNFGRLH